MKQFLFRKSIKKNKKLFIQKVNKKKNEKFFIQKVISTDDFVQIDDRLKKYPDLSYSNKEKK